VIYTIIGVIGLVIVIWLLYGIITMSVGKGPKYW